MPGVRTRSVGRTIGVSAELNDAWSAEGELSNIDDETA